MGLLVMIEGPDASGKTTLAGRLRDTLRDRGLKVALWRFPNDRNPIGDLIRATFAGRATVSREAMLWLFMAEAVDQQKNGPRL